MGLCKTPSFVVSLPLVVTPSQYRELANRFHCAEIIYNLLVRHCNKQLRRLKQDSRYKSAAGKERTALIKEYGLTKYQLYGYVSGTLSKKYKNILDSKNIQDIASRVSVALEKVLYKNGRHLHYKKYGDLSTIGTNTNINKLNYNVDTNMVRFLKMKLKVRNKKLNDIYIKESLKNKIKYIYIKRIPFNTGYRYYVCLVLEGVAPNQNIHNIKGDVGIDIGTSTVAVSSKKAVLLKELSPLNDKYIKQIKNINRKMENSRRISNPDNYNPDGTIKKGKLTWKHSNNYKRLRWLYKTLNRKRAAYIKQFNETIANEILALGNTVYVETMSFKGLQRRAKKTEKNKAGRYKRKKRYGKTLQSRAPAQLIAIIDRKLNYYNNKIYKVDTVSFKASQYNHIDDTYKKKTLGQREAIIGQDIIQRDLYSAFLLMNSQPDLKSADRDKCIKTFSNFKKLHDQCIEQIKQTVINKPVSFGF